MKTRFRARYCQIDVTKIRCTESISAKKYVWKPLKSLFNTVIKRRIDVMQFPAISSHMCAICCYRQKFFFCNFCIYQVLETHGCKAKKNCREKGVEISYSKLQNNHDRATKHRLTKEILISNLVRRYFSLQNCIKVNLFVGRWFLQKETANISKYFDNHRVSIHSSQ